MCNATRKKVEMTGFLYKRINCSVLIIEDCLAIETKELQLHVSIWTTFKNLMLSKKN